MNTAPGSQSHDFSSNSSERAPSTDGLRHDVKHLWKVCRSQEMFQEDLALETVRIRERLKAIARSHEDMFLHEHDVKRMLQFQFKELHKLLTQSFDKSLTLSQDIHQTKLHFTERSDQDRQSVDQLHQTLRAELQHERAQTERLKDEVERLKATCRDYETKSRLVDAELMNQRKFQQSVEIFMHSIRDRMEYLQQHVNGGLSMQENSVKQLQTHFRDNLQSSQQITSNQQEVLSQKIELLHQAQLKLQQSMDEQLQEQNRSSTAKQDALKELLDQTKLKLADLYERYDKSSKLMSSQHIGTQALAKDFVETVSSLKNMVNLLNERWKTCMDDQKKAQNQLEDLLRRKLLEQKHDFLKELERRQQQLESRRDNVFVL